MHIRYMNDKVEKIMCDASHTLDGLRRTKVMILLMDVYIYKEGGEDRKTRASITIMYRVKTLKIHERWTFRFLN